MGRIFREFSITIIISIFASGLVSLTLTPLMTSRLLGKRGEGRKKDLDGAGFGAIEHRVLDVYGRSLWFFLRNRWISAVDLGRVSGGNGYLLLYRSEGLSSGRRQLVHPRRDGCAGGIVSGPDARVSEPGGEDPEGESRGAQHVHHERECHFLGRIRSCCSRS